MVKKIIVGQRSPMWGVAIAIFKHFAANSNTECKLIPTDPSTITFYSYVIHFIAVQFSNYDAQNYCMCTVDPIITILFNPLLFKNRAVQTRITRSRSAIAKISLTCTLEWNTSRHTPGLDWPLNKDNSQQNLCIRRSRTCKLQSIF